MCRPPGFTVGRHHCGKQLFFKLVRMGHQAVVTGTVLEHTNSIHSVTGRLLQGPATETRQRRLGCDDQHWNVIGIGRRNTRNQVCCPWPRGSATDAQLSCLARISVRHECCPRFVTCHDCLQAASTSAGFARQHPGRKTGGHFRGVTSRLVRQRVEERFNSTARYPEHVLHANLRQVRDYQVRIGAAPVQDRCSRGTQLCQI